MRRGMNNPVDSLEFKDRHQWRSWLENNHMHATEAWLIHYKKIYQGEKLALADAVEEALCFGWIDGKLKSLDETKYVVRYSPRRRNSIWSMSNVRRVGKLIGEGRMTTAGLKKVEEAKESGEWDAAIQREQVDIIPPDLEKALRRKKGALAAYRALPDSRKKQYIYWVQSAKRLATKGRRIQSIVEEVLSE
jgi:uncharacterized protein YdeI (YjbR/CyaY-like superfamily)